MKTRPRFFYSYTSRLAVLYATIFSVSTLLLFYFFYFFTASYMLQQSDHAIETEIREIAERYNQEGLAGVRRLINARIRRQQQQATNTSIYLLTDAFGRLAGNLSRWPQEPQLEGDWIEFSLIIDRDTNSTHRARARIFRLHGNYGLLVGRDIHQLTEAKQRIIQALIWGLALMLLLAFIGGQVLGRRTARKIERINQTTHRIMSGDLSRRIPVAHHNDDFDQVAKNLNQMLDQIQTLMEDIRQVSDSIAHDLRTPLSRLRQHLEEARQQQPDTQMARQLADSIQEADSLLSTFNALLRIAQLEAGHAHADFSALDFHTLLQDIVELYEPLAEQKQQQLETRLAKTVTTHGDRDLIFQALANLIENAIKYTPRKGRLRISLQKRANQAVIVIADSGPGIPKAERENVFRRFYRLDRSRSSAGNGLGLSMVSAVLKLHHGRVVLRDNKPSGLKAVVTLPLVAKTTRKPRIGEKSNPQNQTN